MNWGTLPQRPAGVGAAALEPLQQYAQVLDAPGKPVQLGDDNGLDFHKGSAGMARWRRDGKELLYISNQGEIMAVPVSSNPVFQPGPPQLLFRVPGTVFSATVNPGGIMDVTGDNQKLLVEVPVAQSAHSEFTVVMNWLATLKK